ncbi:MAG TPA: glycolate oxidase subunit GlcF [Rhizomicrobium sp.]|nr:glycolate oxidase subunit GlcF [Rhizomicrobium sp.]
MRTNFSPAQLADPHLAAAEENLRNCVHCGICTATCPTYVLLGDERDGPRGRIVMMQQMLEENATPSPETVLHVDRCLSCLACRTACPSSVDYARLVDTARSHIETRYRRPFADRALRWLLATVMPRPALVQVGLFFAPLGRWLPGRLGAMARMGSKRHAATSSTIAPSIATNAKRIALMPGCVQKALAPEIDAAAQRVLARRGYILTPLVGAGCCGSLVHHLGKEEQAKDWAKRAIEAFEREGPFDGILITATGCSAYLKDLAHLFADDPVWAPRAAAFAAKARDFLDLATPVQGPPKPVRVAWQAPCSLQNGLKLADAGKVLLKSAGFEVLDIAEGHLCCGSAGSYSILQPEIAGELRARKLSNIAAVKPDVIATANIGCLHHLSGPGAPPIAHIAELIDWAEGGSAPVVLSNAGIAR